MAYNDIDPSRYDDEFKLIFARYAFSEVPIYMDEDDRLLCSKLYGGTSGISGGVVYRGARIESEKDLATYKSLANGGFLDMKFSSASHQRLEAFSFAQYVKSYDESTTFYALQGALDRGSAGRYGSVLLELAPSAEQIVYNTSNPKLDVGAESELILFGRVRVIRAEVFEPLTKDNYISVFHQLDTADKLMNYNFFFRWMSHHKLDIPTKEKILWIDKKISSYADYFKILSSINNLGLFSSDNDCISYLMSHRFFPKFLSGCVWR